MTGDRRGRIVVIGAGAWGTTLAIVAARAGNRVVLVSGHRDSVDALARTRRHPRSLPGVELPPGIEVRYVGEADFDPEDIAIVAIPVQRIRAELATVAPSLDRTVLVTAAKGLERETLLRPSEIVAQVQPGAPEGRIVALSGPNLAGEVAAGQPATTVVASRDTAVAALVQRRLTSDTFRLYTSTDITGVEMGGALKNIIAIGAGIADGLAAGHNAKAAFMTRGMAEITRLGVACGAEPLTFAGLSGIGDLIATCGSTASRNHTVGRELARGRSLPEVLAGMEETAEGVETTRAAYRLARERGVETPIIDGMHAVLFEGRSAIDAARDLMAREPTSEIR